MAAIVSATFMYCRESSPAILSLILWPAGPGRSRMRFPRLVAFKDDAETVHMEDMEGMEGRLSEGPTTLPV